MKRRNPGGPVAWAVAAILAFAPCVQADDETARHDCGATALAILLRFEGQGASLEQVEGMLPPASPRGHSLAELRDAARTLGLRLEGVRLRPGDVLALDRPIIVHLQRGDVGHYVAVRPVGHTGKLVQLLDNVRDPEVMDAALLLSAREWTGLALVPPRRGLRSWLLAGLTGISGLGAAGCAAWYRFRPGRLPVGSA
jgi:hypothetical protein